MSRAVLTAKHFHDEAAAYAYVEARVWPQGPVCPKCGTMDRVGKLSGKSTRIGTYKCYECRKPFTVKVGTIFEDSHVPMHLWLQAMHFMCSSKKGVSSNQLHRTLGVTLKTAWFMSHRIRLAMAEGGLAPLGGADKVVEADETYIGKKDVLRPSDQRAPGDTYKSKRGKGSAGKRTVVSLVERGASVRSFHIDRATRDGVSAIVLDNVAKASRLHTDESRMYSGMAKHFTAHQTVRHSVGEYVRGDVTTNTVEGFFGLFKRGMKGIYQHCAEKHLHRYLAEFDFRYNNRVKLGVNDVNRADNALRGVVGKRLTYRTVGA